MYKMLGGSEGGTIVTVVEDNEQPGWIREALSSIAFLVGAVRLAKTKVEATISTEFMFPFEDPTASSLVRDDAVV